MITLEENLKNLEKCSRFEKCDINRCPLDFWNKERADLPKEEKCLYWKIVGEKRTHIMFKGSITRQMRGIVKDVRENWGSSVKIGTPKADL